MSSNKQRLCEPSQTIDADWRTLYEASFPENEREPESKLVQRLQAGHLLYHRTTGQNGELLCFSMVSLAPDFSLLAYIAVDQTKRSSGTGSRHMRQLLQELKALPGKQLCLVLEIDSTNPSYKVDEQEKKIRQRRYQFYRRLGAKRLCRKLKYVAPSHSQGGADAELDLLFFNFTDRDLSCVEKSRIVSDTFQHLYGLDGKHPLVSKALAQFTCDPSTSATPVIASTCSEDNSNQNPEAVASGHEEISS